MKHCNIVIAPACDTPLRAFFTLSACVALLGCAAAPDSGGTPGDGVAESQARIVRQMDRPLQPASQAGGPRQFSGSFGRGSLNTTGNATGEWQVRAEVTHGRLRCATYALGVRFGVGNASCSEVDWKSRMEWSDGRQQCNSATLVHSATGRLDSRRRDLSALNCVQVSVGCRGTCG
ncbi:hypothetical protein [Thiorhodovibrio winogradskyi]|nr:hypothetical protein [Thiorhodovibrio winogradskyi]